MIALLGATPVFVDIEPDTYNIDASVIEAAITPRTRAIMPVALYGQAPTWMRSTRLPRGTALPVIDDAAQSFGATYKGRASCNLAHDRLHELLSRASRWAATATAARSSPTTTSSRRHARDPRARPEQRYCHTRVGVGGRMDTLQCAVVLAKLERFDWELERRADIGRLYLAKLETCSAADACDRPT